MNLIHMVVLGIAELPPPPIPGGETSSDAWWRLLGIVLVSLIAIVLFVIIFRPLTPTPAEGVDEQQREEEELARLAAQLSAGMDESAPDATPGILPFQARSSPGDPADQQGTSSAAARLRRILGQAAQRDEGADSERRRLGSRRGHADAAIEPRPASAGTEGQLSRSEAATEDELVQGEKERDDMNLEPTVDLWGDLGEIARRLPSEADREMTPPTPGQVEKDLDLLGELVNRRLSEADQPETTTAESDVHEPELLSGEAPTEHDLNRLATKPPGPGNIVQFVPRQPARADADNPPAPSAIDDGSRAQGEIRTPPAPPSVLPIPVDPATREAIEAVVRQLLFFANVGEVLQGFGLYTDDHLRRFMADSGMPEREFQALFAAVPPKPPEDWTRIEFISRIVRLADGGISADVRYVDGYHPNGTERLTFVQDQVTRRWLIEDIQAV